MEKLCHWHFESMGSHPVPIFLPEISPERERNHTIFSMTGKLDDADTNGGVGCHFGGKYAVLEPLQNGEINSAFDGLCAVMNIPFILHKN